MLLMLYGLVSITFISKLMQSFLFQAGLKLSKLREFTRHLRVMTNMSQKK